MGMSFREARGRGDLASSKIGLRKALLTTCVLSPSPPAPAAKPLPVETGISATPFRLVWLGTDREAVVVLGPFDSFDLCWAGLLLALFGALGLSSCRRA